MRKMFAIWLLLALLVAVSLPLACDDDDDDDNDDGDDDDATDDDATDDDATDDDATDDDATDDDVTDDDDDTTVVGWQWVDVPEMICRDGSATGVGVRYAADSTKVAVFLQDGGACYDPDSCSSNPDHFGEADLTDFADGYLTRGIFDDTNADNPLRDWTIVFVPYCTGDIHAGSQPDGNAPGVPGTQQFVGFVNLTHVATYLAAEHGDAGEAALLGTSAGGFGSLLAYEPFAQAFDVPLMLVDDSGPFVDDDTALPGCYQMLLRLLWNVGEAIPDGCADCSLPNGDGISNILPYLSDTYADAKFGLFSALEDATIRDYWALGQDNCNGAPTVPPEIYSAALIDERDNFLIPTGSWSTFFIDGDTHGILPYSDTNADHVSFFDTAIADDTFTAWVANILDGGTPLQVGP